MKKRFFAVISGVMALAMCAGVYAAPETETESAVTEIAETETEKEAEEKEPEYFFEIGLVEPYAKEDVKYFGNSKASVNNNGKLTELKVKDDVKWEGRLDEKSCFIAGENYKAVITFEGDVEKILGIKEVDTDDFGITMPDYFEYEDLKQNEDGSWEVTLSLSIRKMPKSKDKKHKHDKPLPENEIGKKEASCEVDGFQIYDCQCGYREIKDFERLGHDMKEESNTKATCDKEGVKKEKCTRCGKVEETKTEATGHDYQNVASKPSTCEDEGEQIYECSKCHDTYTEYKPAMGHNWEQAGGGAASCEYPGAHWYICTNHGCSAEKTEEIPAMGHDLVLDYDTSIHYYVCQRPGCGAEVDPAAHDLNIEYYSDRTDYSCWCGYFYSAPTP